MLWVETPYRVFPGIKAFGCCHEVFGTQEVLKGIYELATGDTGVSIRSNGEKDGVGGSGVLSTIGTICVIGLGLVGAYLAFNSFMRSRIRAQRRRRRAERRRSR